MSKQETRKPLKLVGVEDTRKPLQLVGVKKKDLESEPSLQKQYEDSQSTVQEPNVESVTKTTNQDTSLDLQSPTNNESYDLKTQTKTPDFTEPFSVAKDEPNTIMLTDEQINNAQNPQTPEEKKSYLGHLFKDVLPSGLNDFNQMVAGIPESVYTVFSLPQNAVAYATGLDIEASSKKFKDIHNVKNPILDAYVKEGEEITKRSENFDKANYESSSIYDNITKGNYTDALELTVSGVVRSAPISMAMMVGGATMTTSQLATAGTVAFTNQNQEQIDKENPNMPEIEKNIKAIGLSGAEMVFSAIGEGTIGSVYKDILLKEGKDVGTQIFKDGLISAYKKALKSYGAVAGAVGEMVEEGATQITQNMINGKPYMEGVFDAMAIGGASGTVMATPITVMNAKDKINGLIKAKQASKTMSNETKLKIDNIDNAVEKIDGDLQQDIPENIKEKLQAVKQKLVDEKGNAIESDYEKFNNLPQEQKDKLVGVEEKISTLKAEYDEIENNPNISNESKELLKKEKSDEAQQLVNSKNEIVNPKEIAQDTQSGTKPIENAEIVPEKVEVAKPIEVAKNDIKANEEILPIKENVDEEVSISKEDIGIDKKQIKLDQVSESVKIGEIKSSKGETLTLEGQEVNLSYPGKSKFVRKITASNSNGEKEGIISFWKDGDKVIILHVEGENKGSGVGTDLINKVISEAKKTGATEIIADNVEPLKSEKYWEKLGFKQDPESRSNRILNITDEKNQVAPIKEKANEIQEKGNITPNADIKPNIEQNVQQGKDSGVQPTKDVTRGDGDIEVKNNNIANQEKNTNFDDVANFLNDTYINPKDKKDSKVEIKEKLKTVKSLINALPNGDVKTEMLERHKNPLMDEVTVEILDNTINNFDEIVKNANKNVERITKYKKDEKPSRKTTETKTDISPKIGSVQENSSLDESPKAEVKKKKSLRGKTPLDKRKLSKPILKALTIEPTNATDLVQQYFMSGGRMTSKGLKEVFGFSKNNKENIPNGEILARSQYLRTAQNGGKTFTDIVQEIWQSDGNKSLKLDDLAIKEALIDVVSRFNNPTQMAEDFNNKYDNNQNEEGKNENISGEELIDTPYGKMTQEDLDGLILYEESKKLGLENHEENLHILDALSDAEIFKLAENKKLSFDEFIKELDERESATKNSVEVIEPTEKHEDYGEKIGGAKKDIYNTLDKINSDDIKEKPLSKSFPEPNYNELVESGVITKDGAKILKFIYHNIPSKPRNKYKLSQWVKTVESAINTVKELMGNSDGFVENYIKAIETSAFLNNQWEVFSKTMDGLGFPEYNPPKTDYKIKKFTDSKGTKIAITKGHFIIKDFDNIDDAIKGLKTLLLADANGNKKAKVDLGVYQSRTDKTDNFIGKKTATGVKRVVEGFKTVKEAQQYLKENRKQVESIWNDLKVEFNERRDSNRERKGNDWRNGKNISTEEFAKKFGFRSIEYGNWVNNDERQKSVNDAHDALMDLASVLNISPESLSLNGTLALAFGARGSGTASAHYESSKVVINLTKKKGAGSLAHEWFHGLDNYISTLRDKKSEFITDRPRVDLVREGGLYVNDNRIRQELLSAFKGLVDSINKTDLKKRSKNLDSTRSKLYWSTTIEMAARSFENYIIEKLGNNNEHNDYLANFKETTEWIGQTGLDLKDYPYPLKEESESINSAFDEVFETIGESEKFSKKTTTEKKLHAKIDKAAQWAKNTFPGIKDPNLKGNGYTQDQLIDLIAQAAKKLVSASIDINQAIKQVVAQVKEKFGIDINPDDVKAKLEGEKPKVEPKVEKEEVEKPIVNKPKSENKGLDGFRDKIKDLPNSGEFSKYLSGETIEREHSELRNNQDIEVLVLSEAGEHGLQTVEMAKEIFGEQYVEKTLEYLSDANLKSHEMALVYVSLENDMHNRVLNNPESVSEKKLQDLVRAKSQQHLREASLSINAGRLRAIMKDGYITDGVTNKMYSPEQLAGKKKIQKAIEANMDAINKEAELQENDTDFDFEIKEPKIKRSPKVVKLEIAETLKKMRADLLRVAKGDMALASIPYAAQLKAATPHIIKLSKLLAELGGMKTRAIINEIHNQIKDIFPDINKQDITNVVKENNKPKVRNNKVSEKAKAAKEFVKQALIEKGFGREINVRVNEKDAQGNIIKDENGRNKKVKEKRNTLDWKKLAGEAGTIENIQKNVESVLKEKGYTDAEIKNMSKEYQDEYDNLRAGVIEKSLNELNRRNEVRKRVDVKSSAKRLAELFNYGLFEKESTEYSNLINSALGFNEFDNASFKELELLAKSLADLYNTGISETGLQSGLASVNKQISRTLSNAAYLQSNTPYKMAAMVSEYINLSTRFLLVKLSQLIENPFSGYAQRAYTKMAYLFEGTDNDALSDQRLKVAQKRFQSIVRDGGNAYGDTSSLLINDSKVENWLNKATTSEFNHTMISFYMGRAFLEGFDSRHKTVLTEKYFVHNLIKVLTNPSNPNRMSKADALNFVTEHQTGQSFEDALTKAREVTEKINKDADRKVLNDNERSIIILAQDIMKDTLLKGGIMTQEQIESAYKAGYKGAGSDIGHVANNQVSKMVGLLNNHVETQLQQSIKEKNWDKAAMYTLTQMFTRNIMNTFIGGGTNWVVLGLQKSGIYGAPSVAWTKYNRPKGQIDLTTDLGIKNLEEKLFRDLKYKNTSARVILGSGLALITASIMMGTGADDDLYEWLEKKENKWAHKYFNKLAPEIVILMMALMGDNKSMKDYFYHLVNAKVEFFDNSANTAKALTDLVSDKPNKGAAAGQLLGSKTNFPAPVGMAKDIRAAYNGITGRPQVPTEYKSSGFLNGFTQGGLLDFLGLRYGESQSDIDLREDNENRAKPTVHKTTEEKNENKMELLERESERIEKIKEYNLRHPKNPIKYVPPKALQKKIPANPNGKSRERRVQQDNRPKRGQ